VVIAGGTKQTLDDGDGASEAIAIELCVASGAPVQYKKDGLRPPCKQIVKAPLCCSGHSHAHSPA